MPKADPILCERCRVVVDGQEDGDRCSECEWVFCYECLPPELHKCEAEKP